MSDIYDDPAFFAQYAKMDRSRLGLAGAGEWPSFQQLLPPLNGKAVLDLGCGYGWHCRYAAAQGASRVLGIDASKKMLAQARKLTKAPQVTYQQADIATFQPKDRYDLALSSLVLHYIADLLPVYRMVFAALRPGGVFQFTIEHPIFTAEGHQEWVLDEAGQPTYWPVDHYFTEGTRTADFLNTPVTKYHHTLTTIINGLISVGFTITAVAEPAATEPSDPWARVPMMLIVQAQKPTGK